MADVPDRSRSVRVDAEHVARVEAFIRLVECGAAVVVGREGCQFAVVAVRAGAEAGAAAVPRLTDEVRVCAATRAGQRIAQPLTLRS
ncbi:hypothetical protein ACFXP7_01685 [Microbacterium sp. P06]|uniref:hypothetical protein n=1 Tax=Microbacterium sp. P06 TaxID=3366949 RepID=UPI003746429B